MKTQHILLSIAFIAGILVSQAGTWVIKKTSLNTCLRENKKTYLKKWGDLCEEFGASRGCIHSPFVMLQLNSALEAQEKKCHLINEI